jgi:hypothetical protein
MITCELGVGLGNDLFRLAAAKQFSINKEDTLVVPEWNIYPTDDRDGFDIVGIKKYNDIFKTPILSDKKTYESIGWTECHEKQKFIFNKLDGSGNIKIIGSFQNEKYFKKEIIYDFFSPSDKIVSYIKEKYTDICKSRITSIHVRRGDYVKLQHLHPLQSMEYFNKAIEIINEETDFFFVFSDDIEWCEKNFIGNKFSFIKNEKNYTDLFLMSMCTNNIISNSSFSWWAAYMNFNKNKKVIAPKKWLGPDLSHDTSDLCPKEWIEI